MTVQLNPAITFVKAATALVRERGSRAGAIEALQESGNMQSAMVLRSAVGDTGENLIQPSPASDGFLQYVRPQSILGRLRGVRTVPFGVEFPVESAPGSAYWVGAGLAKPVTKLSLTSAPLPPTKLAVITVVSGAVARLAGPAAEASIQQSLTASVAQATDEGFLSDGAGVSGAQPAGILHGVSGIAATADPAVDLKALIDAFEGDLTAASFVMHPTTAAALALHRDTHGAYTFADVGPRGGTLLGLPVLTSRSVPLSSAGSIVALIDAGGIVVADEGVRLDASQQATVEMSDSPTNSAATGTGTSQVSMFQTDAVALLVERSIGWSRARDNAVAFLEGVSW